MSMTVPSSTTYDAIVIGSGMGGLVTATQLASKGIRVLVLERYLIPGGSAGAFSRQGYHFDVGASMIFGLGQQGSTNLLTRALAAVDQTIESIPDPVQVHYHLPDFEIAVDQDYGQFLQKLQEAFPHESEGIAKFYGECWAVFNCLNSMELLSLEEPRYLARTFWKHPLSCLRLARYLPLNVGDIARRHLRDPRLLRFIDMECFCWSVMPADRTPMINAGMVFSDRHYGGVNYPKGGVGAIATALVKGLKEFGGEILYRARVTKILEQNGRAIGVKLADGREFQAPAIISNSTRWQTFGDLWETVPPKEHRWRKRYQAAPSFVSLHLGVKADAIPPDFDCHHIVLEDWDAIADSGGTVFVSIPTLLDPSLAPPGRHIVHTFTPSWMHEWANLSPSQYQAKKQTVAQGIIDSLSGILPKLQANLEYQEIGSPRTHRRFLGRQDGTYGPIPAKQLNGLLGMPFNQTAVPGLYIVGDSTFPGQGLNAVAFSGFACAHRVATTLGH